MEDNKISPLPQSEATQLVHLGRDPRQFSGFVNTPAFRGSTVLYPSYASLLSKDQPYTYGRRGTPTTRGLEHAIKCLENGSETKLAASGLQAITTTLLALVEAGDHILISDSVYNPTRQFCNVFLKRLGVEVEFYDPLIGRGIDALFRSNTRLVYIESPGSQTFELQDVPGISAVAHLRDIWVVADNTWAGPLYCKPLDLGADVSILAATKYLVGHADALLGAVTSNARAASFIAAAADRLGVCPGSEETFLALRGLRTLDVRLARHHESGIVLADWLSARPEVAKVLHPGLPGDRGYNLFRRDFRGASGLFSIILRPVSQPALAAFLDGLNLFGMGYSWGGYESLVVPFDCTHSRSATRWVADGPALRFHVGLEAPSDLMADLEAAFARMNAHP